MLHLIFDLDNTIWNKQAIDDEGYRRTSQNVFGRQIHLLSHPITGEQDTEFATRSNREIWQYKLSQIIDAGERLEMIVGGITHPLASAADADIDQLVSQLGIETFDHVRSAPRALESVVQYLDPNTMYALVNSIPNLVLGVASFGERPIASYLLDRLGYHHAGLDERLCTFSDEGTTKEDLLRVSLAKFEEVHRVLPHTVVYIGDAVKDMQAVTVCNAGQHYPFPIYRGVGVLTGQSSESALYAAGASLVLPSLADAQSINTLHGFLSSNVTSKTL